MARSMRPSGSGRLRTSGSAAVSSHSDTASVVMPAPLPPCGPGRRVIAGIRQCAAPVNSSPSTSGHTATRSSGPGSERLEILDQGGGLIVAQILAVGVAGVGISRPCGVVDQAALRGIGLGRMPRLQRLVPPPPPPPRRRTVAGHAASSAGGHRASAARRGWGPSHCASRAPSPRPRRAAARYSPGGGGTVAVAIGRPRDPLVEPVARAVGRRKRIGRIGCRSRRAGGPCWERPPHQAGRRDSRHRSARRCRRARPGTPSSDSGTDTPTPRARRG